LDDQGVSERIDFADTAAINSGHMEKLSDTLYKWRWFSNQVVEKRGTMSGVKGLKGRVEGKLIYGVEK
jgi:hypothetical protein